MYTFARWVTTPENRSALAAVRRLADALVASSVRPEPNPLVLHGPAGTGKTHLVSALIGCVSQARPTLTCTHLTAAEAADLLRPAEESWRRAARLSPGAEEEGRQAGRPSPREDWHSDLLAIEDLQHLPARAAEALAGVLDARTARAEPTVFTATAGPARLTHLPARLTSRLVSGLVVGLEPLAPASRLALLQDRAQRRQLALGRDVLAWLAEHAGGSGRQLEGALARVEALTRLHGRLPDLALVTAQFEADAAAGRPTVERIAERVGAYFRLEPRQIQSRRRLRQALLPRQVGMYLARRLTPLSLQQIGAYFGGRDHSTVLHACRKVEEAMSRDAALSGAVRQLHADLA
jgi:chromosomal replication initiator protein